MDSPYTLYVDVSYTYQDGRMGELMESDADRARGNELYEVPRRGRGRRPSEQVRQEILDAAGRLLMAEGMAGFTIERVAALAGASKMTIYKWWPSKGTLALEGYASTVDGLLGMPDTGDIETDLTTQLLTYVRLLRDTPAGRITAELLGAAQTDPDLAAAFRRTYSGPRRAVGIAALRTARSRGQIRADADPEMLIDQLWGACLYRLIMGDQPLTDEFAKTVVRNLFHGIRPEDGTQESARVRTMPEQSRSKPVLW